MKRRNFLSRSFALPLLRWLRSEHCGKPVFPPDSGRLIFCTLPHGHKGPHMFVNRRMQISPLSFGPRRPQ